MNYLVVMIKGDETTVVFKTDTITHAQAVITEEARLDKDAEFHIYGRVV